MLERVERKRVNLSKQYYRTDPMFLRNAYDTDGKWNFPIVKKQEIIIDKRIELISVSDTSMKDTKNLYKGIHFYVDDPRFEDVYRNPERSLEKFSKYRFLLLPDFSLFNEMPLWRQIESIGKSRWCGAYWQSHGLLVIPSISWGLFPSYDFCFDGIEHGSIVAIGMIGCKNNKTKFLRGYFAMLDRIEPSHVICFGTPFVEMGANIIVVDYIESRKVVR